MGHLLIGHILLLWCSQMSWWLLINELRLLNYSCRLLVDLSLHIDHLWILNLSHLDASGWMLHHTWLHLHARLCDHLHTRLHLHSWLHLHAWLHLHHWLLAVRILTDGRIVIIVVHNLPLRFCNCSLFESNSNLNY